MPIAVVGAKPYHHGWTRIRVGANSLTSGHRALPRTAEKMTPRPSVGRVCFGGAMLRGQGLGDDGGLLTLVGVGGRPRADMHAVRIQQGRERRRTSKNRVSSYKNPSKRWRSGRCPVSTPFWIA